MNTNLGPYATLPDFFDFMIWADRLIMDAAAQVPDAEYHADRKISFGSLHLILLHAMGAQRAWLNRLRGIPGKLYLPSDFPTRDALLKHWPSLHQEALSWLSQQTAQSLALPIRFNNFQGQPFTLTAGQGALHMTDHASFHRGQQNTLLKLAGGTPVRAWFYLWAAEHRPTASATP